MGMILANVLLWLLKLVVLLFVLYVGKEIIDIILLLIDGESIGIIYFWMMVGLEFVLVIVFDFMN